MPEQAFGQLTDVFVVGVGLVELEHRKFGIVLRRDALIPEVAVDFKDALQAPHHQPLQVEFRRHAKVEVEVERVVVRRKGPGQRAARQRLHHRRFHLHEVFRFKKAADSANQAAALRKTRLRFGVGGEVQVTLPVAELHIREPVPLFG